MQCYHSLTCTVQREEKNEILEFLVNPDSKCLSESLLADPQIPRWVFSDDPPEESPSLHLPGSGRKIGVWSLKHSSTYITGVGYLVRDGSRIVVTSGPFFGFGDLSFSSSNQGIALSVQLHLNDWKQKGGTCRCHCQVPPSWTVFLLALASLNTLSTCINISAY